MGKEPTWIVATMAIAIHDNQIVAHGGAYGLRDEGLLGSALARPRDRWGYEGGNLFVLAAAYGYGIAKNHPFVDGNKRTAFQVMYAFLRVNGFVLTIPEPEVVVTMRTLAAGGCSEEQLAQWLEKGSDRGATK